MTGYLQRLFDRGGADAPMPAGPSMSPVAQADQRLTVPGIGDALMWQPTAFGAEAEPGADAFPSEGTAARAAPRALDTPVSRPTMPSRGSGTPQPVTPVAAAGRAQPPVALDPGQPAAVPAAPSPIRRIGAIEAGDLELPADSDPQARPAASGRQVQGEAEAAEPAPAAQPVGDRARPTAEPVPTPPAAAVPARDSPPPVDHHAPDREPAAAASPAVPAAAAEAPRLAEPASPPPALAVPVPEPEPPPLEAPTPPQAAPRPPAPRPEPRRNETLRAPEPPKPLRPLTANEVSVIGPLPPGRRSATLFGLRRR